MIIFLLFPPAKPLSSLPVSTDRLKLLTLAAAVCNSNTAPLDSAEEVIATTEQSIPIADNEVTNSTSEEDKNDSSEGLDEHKMIRVCDKLIGVFLVDKPTPTDWRRLLAFSKEWDNIRPHFYKRCQDRADNEGDPGMKHSLLRLARKLKEVFFFPSLLEVVQSVWCI